MAYNLEIWGGLECTLNQVGAQSFDQLEFSGHYERCDDLDRIADLGIRTLRFPILWERWGRESDWSWLDRRMKRLRELNIRPIVGLVHHGSGPRGADLTRPAFATGLARFAGRVARRYPWVCDYTPVNEPLTTARFCALYGHWAPHQRSDGSFARALVYQCLAIARAMTTIRRWQPAARLLQTEDLGKVHSVPELLYQAEWENQRRWLSLDLLCGRVGPSHPHYAYLAGAGLEPELATLVRFPSPPQVLGWNYYVTGERFLESDWQQHPSSSHGGNAREFYADVEAVRVGRSQGLPTLLQEAWERYRLPMVISEAHLGCTREEQLRWLQEVWDSAGQMRRAGIDIQAVTSWALLGSFEWNSLVTRLSGHYEPGAFDVRSQPPRETAVGGLIRHLAGQAVPRPTCLDDPGWWRARPRLRSRPLGLLGCSTALGLALQTACQRRGLAVVCVALGPGWRERMREVQPWALLNAAQYVCRERAECDPLGCYEAHVELSTRLARWCADHQVGLLSFSGDQVFDGDSNRPYLESDSAAGTGVFGRTQRQAEQRMLGLHPSTLLVRSAAILNPYEQGTGLRSALEQLRRGRSLGACPSTVHSPTLTTHVLDMALDLLLDGERGLWHLANQGQVSWLEMLQLLARTAGLPATLVRPASHQELGWRAPRASFSALSSERGQLMPDLERALYDFVWETDQVEAQAREVTCFSCSGA